MLQFDRIMAQSLQEKVKTTLTMKGKVDTYRFCDEVWTFVVEDVSLRFADRRSFDETMDVSSKNRLGYVLSKPLDLNSNLFSKSGSFGATALVFPQPSTVSKSMLNAGPKANSGSCGATSGILFGVETSAASSDSGCSSPGLESWAPSVIVGQDISGRRAPPAVFCPPDVTGGEGEKILEKKSNLFSFRLFESVDDIGGIMRSFALRDCQDIEEDT
ncbi:Transcription initiation factor IIA subunit 2 [Maublancomyces gigas]|uniref:Transcription initiation factor IIA subunit 2 n=1 Tax=Discina gigas TaxID=1032678 RepID=A0ABR3GQJ8_9PEZI